MRMPVEPPVAVTAILGSLALAFLPIWRARPQTVVQTPPLPVAFDVRPAPRDPMRRALKEAKTLWTRAGIAVNQERYDLEAWDRKGSMTWTRRCCAGSSWPGSNR